MQLDTLALLNAERAARRAAILVTDLDGGAQRVVREEEIALDPFADHLAKALAAGQSGCVSVEGRDVFLTVQAPPVRLVVIGAVHISQALAPMARALDLAVTVIDPRTAFATPERFPGIDLVAEWPDDALGRAIPPLDRYCAVAALTHDPKIDDPALMAALRAECFYVGALGSRKTHAARVARLTQAGFSEAQIGRIAAPIGLPIGAVSPAEIAVSILGQIVAALRGPRAGGNAVKFGAVPTREAAGLIAAHTVRAHDVILKKGRVIPREDALRLDAGGLSELVAVTLEPGDVAEDAAAERLAAHLAGPHLNREPPFTGRCNLHAAQAGLLLVDRAAIDAVNGVDEAITAATLPAYKPVVAGEMVATVKIIPYAVPGEALARACRAAPVGAIRVEPYRLARIGVVSTLLSGLKPATIDKTLANLRHRLAATGADLVTDARVAHRAGDVAAAIRASVEMDRAELVVVFGASAIADRRDVIPAGIEAAGGRVEHLGMPVDPGNLLLVGALAGVPVIGAPGCARSPKENGFDWVLHRLLAGLAVTRADIVALGVGGLLMEIVSRPQPRSGGDPADDDA